VIVLSLDGGVIPLRLNDSACALGADRSRSSNNYGLD
jgi:hypothetical protein